MPRKNIENTAGHERRPSVAVFLAELEYIDGEIILELAIAIPKPQWTEIQADRRRRRSFRSSIRQGVKSAVTTFLTPAG